MNAVASSHAARPIAETREGWNAYIASTPGGHVLQSWEWGEIKAATGWEVVRIAIAGGPRPRGAAQVQIRALPFGLGRIGYVAKGPVLDWQDAGAREQMVAELRSLAAERGLVSLKIEPELLDGPVNRQIEALGLVPAEPVQMRSTIWVDLTAGEEEMLARQKQKTRYNIRLAQKRGVTVAEAATGDLDEWYAMYLETARRDGFAIHSLDYYRLVLDTLAPRGMATLLVARHEGDLLAGIIVFHLGRSAQYMYGASSNLKRNLMAPYLVQWEGMRWARARGAEVYDLWGIPDRLEEGEDLWGVYRHKRGYGGEIARYAGAYDLVQSPLRHAALERVARPLMKKAGRVRTQGFRAAGRAGAEALGRRVRGFRERTGARFL